MQLYVKLLTEVFLHLQKLYDYVKTMTQITPSPHYVVFLEIHVQWFKNFEDEFAKSVDQTSLFQKT